MDLIGFIFYYLIGMVGAWLGLFMIVYILYSYIHIKKLHIIKGNDCDEIKLDKLIIDLYNYIGIDYKYFDYSKTRINMTTALICGVYAAFGPYALITSFFLCLISYFIIVVIQYLNHK